MKAIASRMKIAYWRVRKIINEKIVDPDIAFSNNTHPRRFTKLHDRARQVINNTFMSANNPLYVPEI
jgi:hypothetical protein